MKKEAVKLNAKKLKIFKIKNRTGYAAIYGACLTEGKTAAEARERMVKAVCRKPKAR